MAEEEVQVYPVPDGEDATSLSAKSQVTGNLLPVFEEAKSLIDLVPRNLKVGSRSNKSAVWKLMLTCKIRDGSDWEKLRKLVPKAELKIRQGFDSKKPYCICVI
jgi:hypothetical protein